MPYTIKQIKAILKPKYPPGYVAELIQISKNQREELRIRALVPFDMVGLKAQIRDQVRENSREFNDYDGSHGCEIATNLINNSYLHGKFSDGDLKGMRYEVYFTSKGVKKIKVEGKVFTQGLINPVQLCKLIAEKGH